MPDVVLTRREVLRGALGVAAGALLAGCGIGGAAPVGPAAIAAAESARPRTGRVRTFSLTAQPASVDLGGTVVDTWAYGDTVPGRPLRVTAGDRARIRFRNELPEATSVHWHGLAIRNDMDGVPGLTTPESAAGGEFAFDFVVPDAGTYWFHPHHGLQLDHGLYAAFLVDDPAEPGAYDAEWVVVLDDWTDGVGPSPQRIYADLRAGRGPTAGMGGMRGGGNGMHGTGIGGHMGLAPDRGDVAYPLYLVNGRTLTDPDVLRTKPGRRVRLRLVNAAADTAFDVAVAGHQLEVTHTDGYPVAPVTTDVIRIGMGERYDAVVTVGDGVFPLVAAPVGKSGLARALVRSGGGEAPPEDHRPEELDGDPSTVTALQAAPGAALPTREPDAVQDVLLGGSMRGYVWTINGRTYPDTDPLTIRQGEAGRLRIRNHTMMAHPVHLHGHTFQLGPAGGTGPRKDTLLVPAMAGANVDLIADNPGTWLLHCHNAYHAQAGMMTRLGYRT